MKFSKRDNGVIYLIFGRSRDGIFRLMDFWGLPYTFRGYKDAKAGALKIGKRLKKFQWEDQKPVIMKIEF